jgi:hypothetical protein
MLDTHGSKEIVSCKQKKMELLQDGNLISAQRIIFLMNHERKRPQGCSLRSIRTNGVIRFMKRRKPI